MLKSGGESVRTGQEEEEEEEEEDEDNVGKSGVQCVREGSGDTGVSMEASSSGYTVNTLLLLLLVGV